ncbi:hypothetical protein ACFY36_17595 [Actinoplanes sp. NPDC000266]
MLLARFGWERLARFGWERLARFGWERLARFAWERLARFAWECSARFLAGAPSLRIPAVHSSLAAAKWLFAQYGTLRDAAYEVGRQRDLRRLIRIYQHLGAEFPCAKRGV